MAWVDKGLKYMVTFTDLQTSGFDLKPGQFHVTSQEPVTKSEAIEKYVFDSTNMAGHGDNYLVPKRTFLPVDAVTGGWIEGTSYCVDDSVVITGGWIEATSRCESD